MDSKILVSKISQMTAWNIYFPAVTLQPEWNTLQAILNMIKKLPTCPQLSERTTQDDEHDYNSLTLAAQLNKMLTDSPWNNNPTQRLT